MLSKDDSWSSDTEFRFVSIFKKEMIVMKCFDSLESFDARSAMKDFDGILDITIPERQSFAVRYNGP